MSELVTVTLKMSAELRDQLKEQAAEAGTSVSALLIDGVTGKRRADPRRVAELEAESARLLTERNQWRDRAQAIVSAGAAKQPTSNAEGRRLARGTDPMGRSAHPAGPVLATTAPEVASQTGWCGLKGLDKKPSR